MRLRVTTIHPATITTTAAGNLKREIAPDGGITLADGRCRFTFRRIAPATLEVVIDGVDMPAVSVSREWSRFFALNQKDLKRVSVLVGSKGVELTVAIAQHLSQTGKLIQLYSDAELYESRKPK